MLGQNWPFKEKEKLDQPDKLLVALLNRASVDRTQRKDLCRAFKDFLSYYGAIRHFGWSKHRKVTLLTPEKIYRFILLTIEIWDLEIATHRKNPRNKIDEFKSISAVVEFKEFPARGSGCR